MSDEISMMVDAPEPEGDRPDDRGLFESWATVYGYSLKLIDGTTTYFDNHTWIAFHGWRAAIKHARLDSPPLDAQSQAALDSLPRTADGVPVILGMTVWWVHNNLEKDIRNMDVKRVEYNICCGYENKSVTEQSDYVSFMSKVVFSTRYAALTHRADQMQEKADAARCEAEEADDAKTS